MWNFKTIDSIDDSLWLDHLMKAEVSHVFYHPLLMRAWMDTYRPLRDIRPITVVATAGDGNRALLPLVLWRRSWRQGWVRSIVPVGFSDYDYHDPLFLRKPSAEELESFWSELLCFLRPYGADETVLVDMRTEVTGRGDGWTRRDICPNKNLAGMDSEDSLMAFFSTKLRGDIRRQMRRLGETGELTMKEYASADEVPEALWTQFMESHRRKWPQAYKAPGLHRRLLDCCSVDGPVHFSALMAGGTAVAWHLGFEFRGVYYYYMPCGNADYSRQSPVKVHLYHLMARAIGKGCALFDHLRGDEAYKDGWSDGFTHVNTLTERHESIGLAVKTSLLKVKHLVMAMKQNTPPYELNLAQETGSEVEKTAA